MKSAKLVNSWYRCRIKSRKAVSPWIYFCVESQNQRELTREARYWAGLVLRRQIFEISTVSKPDKLIVSSMITHAHGEMTFYFEPNA